MGKVVYITGAPATGKSTLCSALTESASNIDCFCYSERLRDYVNQQRGSLLDEIDIRRESARSISAEDVQSVDELLLTESRVTRESARHLLIDSHPVTKEDYGFRVTPFSDEDIRAMEVDVFVCLYADPHVLGARISANPQGRPLPSPFELALHVQLQASVVAQYAVITGRPCYLLNSEIPRDELMQQVKRLLRLDV
ncbi:ATP-binding protein [Dyella sedimenti]|uniref:ATP-binding protein n=1 Tax=Dyella sedimenti TaxID=2919947 RepID=UPI003CE4B0D0